MFSLIHPKYHVWALNAVCYSSMSCHLSYPIQGTCLSILNSLLVNEDDNDYLKTIIRIPTQPLLAYLEPPGGESDGDSGVDNTRLRSSSDALSQPQQQQQLLQPTSSADNSRPSSISGPFLEVAKKGRGLSFHSEASDSSSSRSLVRWVCLGMRWDLLGVGSGEEVGSGEVECGGGGIW